MSEHIKATADGNRSESPDLVAHEVVTANKTLSNDDNGKVLDIGTNALVMALPLIGPDKGNSEVPVGTRFTFRNIGADAANDITISPNAVDAIHGTIANAAADSVSGGVVDKDIVNTGATSNKGDYLILEAGALLEWYIVGGVGIWASEA